MAVRQFLKLVILNRNSLEDASSREASDYLDSKFAEVLKRINSPIVLDCERSLSRYYWRFNDSGLNFQPFSVPIDMYEDAEPYENRKYISLRPSKSTNKFVQGSRMLSSTMSLSTSQIHYRQ